MHKYAYASHAQRSHESPFEKGQMSFKNDLTQALENTTSWQSFENNPQELGMNLCKLKFLNLTFRFKGALFQDNANYSKQFTLFDVLTHGLLVPIVYWQTKGANEFKYVSSSQPNHIIAFGIHFILH